MRRDTRIYQFTDENLIAIFDNCLDERDRVFKRAKKFARKHGLNDNEFLVLVNYDMKNGCGIAGMTTYKRRYGRWAQGKTVLDPKLWTKRSRDSGWPPYWRVKKTGPAKILRKEWDDIGKWDLKPITDIIGWRDIFDETTFPLTMKRFNPWWIRKDGSIICGFAYNLPGDKKQDYKPPRGLMKKISHDEYQKITESI